MKAHLLFADEDFDADADLPWNHEDLVLDLELSTLLHAMANGDRFLFDVSRRVLLAGVDDVDSILYRQHVLADAISHPRVIRDMYEVAVAALEDRRSIWSGYGGSYQSPQSTLAGAVRHLEAYIARLRELRRIADEHAEEFESAGLRNFLSTLRQQLSDEYFAEVSEHLKQLRFRGGIFMSARLDNDNSGIDFVLRAPVGSGRSWKHRLGIGARSSYSFTVPVRDEGGIQVLQDLGDRGINLVANATAQSADHLKSYFTMLRFELGYYVACVNLHDRVVEKPVPVTFPEPAPLDSVAFSCTDLRDVSLALQSDSPVIGNDVEGDGKELVIITGANSGGKSTFLRSVGAAQLMMQSGLFVTAREYRANVVTHLFTHFIREEDSSMQSGRFDEELGRMSAIADHLRPRCLVLFNESFAGTNELEGSEIARQIVRALLESTIKVFAVTHRFDFAQSFFERHADFTLFLRADRLPDGARSYKLATKRPLPTSFGEDLYYRLGAWLAEDEAERKDREGEEAEEARSPVSSPAPEMDEDQTAARR